MKVAEIRSLDDASKKSLISELKKAYLSKGRQGCSEVLGCKYQSVSSFTQVLGIDLNKWRSLRNIKNHYNKVNNPFIENSSLKWYLVGYILGDGSLTDNGLNISSSDKDMIDHFARVFQVNVQGPWRGNYTISFIDYGVAESLRNLGFVMRKSMIGMNLPTIPEEFRYNFLLGLLDSDGCCSVSGSLRVLWYGHVSYMMSVKDMLTTMGYHPNIRDHNGRGLYRVQIQSKESKDFYSKAIKGLDFFNVRKYSVCQSYQIKKSRITKQESEELNNQILKEEPPRNRTELLELASRLGISEDNLTKRLVRLGLKYKPDYSRCGTYERKH